MDLQVVVISAEGVDPQLRTPVGDPAHEAGALVASEVEASGVAKVFDQALEIVSGFQRHVSASAATSVTSFGAISSSARMKSTSPVLIAADGIPKNSDVASS